MKELVTFMIGDNQYGVQVEHMQGIENYKEMSQAVGMPDCLEGIVLIRQEMIPVFDIRRCLTLPASPVTPQTKYLIFRTGKGKLGIVVDDIAQIVKAEDREVRSFPALLQSDKTHYADCIIKSEGKLIVVINPNQILTKEEWGSIDKALEDMRAGGSDD